MRASILTGIAALGLFGALAAHAEEAVSNSPEVVAATDPNRTVCAYLYHEGSVVRRPECHPAQYWVSEHQRGRREFLEWQLRMLQWGNMK